MRLPLSVSTLALLALMGVLALTLSSTVDAGGRFSPTFAVALEDQHGNAVSGYDQELVIPSGDYNFYRNVATVPEEWGVTPGNQIPIGELVAELDSDATLGLFNAPCNQALPVHFDFMNASLNTAETVSYRDDDFDFTSDFAEDENGNGLFDGVDRYPSFLNEMFPGMEPLRRYAAMTIVAGIPVLLQYITFEPGTEIPGLGPIDDYASVLVLQDIGSPDPWHIPSVITDFCTPLGSSAHFRGETDGGTDLFTNPGEGTYTFSVRMEARRDADGDGYENVIDTCPLAPNVGNPRISLDGDLDSDGLDAACDPNDSPIAGGTNSDEDADGYQNRQDNCPLVSNGEMDGNQVDTDLDDIGDHCDPDPNVPDGDSLEVTRNDSVVVGDSAPPALSGDVDCDGNVTVRDAQMILRSVLDQPIDLPVGCPEPGEPVG